MKRIRPFRYFEPGTVAEVVEVLNREGRGAYPLAGGTDLLVRMKRGDIVPAAVINLKRVSGLGGIERERAKNLRIGALVTIGEVERSDLVRESHGVLGDAARVVGSPSIRNLGTAGGNIGRASPASDLAPALMVLGAKVCIEDSKGKRELGVEEFFKGPGLTVLSPGELITSFNIPAMERGSRAVYLRLGRREGMDCALVGVAVWLALSGSDSGVKSARVALGAVGPVPLRAKGAEEVLLSGSLTQERMQEAARVAMGECFPISDMRGSGEYRREMVGVLVRRALEAVRGEGEGGKK